MHEPLTISDEDIAQFAERIHFNARPLQRRVWGWHVTDCWPGKVKAGVKRIQSSDLELA